MYVYISLYNGGSQGQGLKESWGTDGRTNAFFTGPEQVSNPTIPRADPKVINIIKTTSKCGLKRDKIGFASVFYLKQSTSTWTHYLRYQTHLWSLQDSNLFDS